MPTERATRPARPSTAMARESSKKQAERIRREYAEKTRRMHSQMFGRPQTAPQELTAEQRAALDQKDRDELERAEAQAAFEEQIKKSEMETRAVIAKMKELAIAKEKDVMIRAMARQWRKGAKEARLMGPYAVPGNVKQGAALFDNLRATPRGAVCAFLLALLRKVQNRKVGNDLLALALNPDCMQSEGVVRKWTYKMVAKIDKHVLASYAVGSTPQNGYIFDPEAVKFEFDGIASSKFYGDAEGEIAQVFVVTTGAPPTYPTSRPVEVKLTNGKWGVRTFTKLSTHVIISKGLEHASLEDDSYSGDYQPVRRSDHERYTPAIDFSKARRKLKAKNAAEKEKERIKRHEKAAAETSSLAEKLAHRDLCKEWHTSSPRLPRRIVSGDGTVETKSLDQLNVPVSLEKLNDPENLDKSEDAAYEKVDGENGEVPVVNIESV